MLISVEDSEERAKMRLNKAMDKVKELLQPVVSVMDFGQNSAYCIGHTRIGSVIV